MFSRNQEIRLECLPKEIFFAADHRILQNAMGKKHFSAWNHTTHTNHQWEMFFFFFFINLGYGMEINRQIDFG